ncbi:ABC transporter substrate binding protein [Litoribrevibacter euphylliae]|uniref:histidine kinase n=1 Tax=Litoribrevibacter euphylliae TaxID=1834034 RepID=A0ABV7HMT9_9GAMM
MSLESIAEKRKQVLVISAYHPAFPTFYHQNRGVREGLQELGFSSENMDLDYEYMDSKRFFTDENIANFTSSIRYKLSQLKRPYDVLLVADDNALDFAIRHQSTLFQNIPIVFFGVNNVNKALLLDADPQVTGVVEAISIKETFDLIKRIHGDKTSLQVIVDNTPSGQSNLKSIIAYQVRAEGVDLEVLDLSRMTFSQLAKELASSSGDAVLLLSGFRDAVGTKKDFYELTEFLETSSPNPIYHFWRHGVGEGLFGGKVVSHFEQGRIAARIAGEVLKGGSVAEFPVIADSPNVYMFDYTKLNDYGLSESLIPESAHWLNKPITLRESNPQAYWIAMAIFLSCVFIIACLFGFIWMRRRVVNRLERAYDAKTTQLKKTYDDLVQAEKMASLGRLVAGVAHEINTPVGVSVTTTTYLQSLFDEIEQAYHGGELSKRQLESFIDNCKEGSEILMGSLSGAAQLISSFKQVAVDQTGEQCRKIAIAEYIQSIAFSLTPKLKLKGVEVDVVGDAALEITTYPGAVSQVFTNLFMNSLIHGFEDKKTLCQIRIEVKPQAKGVEIIYQDNGKGMDAVTLEKAFDPFFTTKMGKGGSGLGLNIVYNLTKNKLNGQIHCESKEGQGVLFRIELANMASPAKQTTSELTDDVAETGQVLH